MQKSFMQRFLQLMLLVTLGMIPGVSMSQTNGFVCDFENDADTAAWDYVTDTTRLKWCIGSATSVDEGRSIYLSADLGATNSYYAHEVWAYAYREVSLTAGDYEYSFDWKCVGEHNFDFMRVALAPASAVIVSGSNNGITRNQLPSGWIALDGGSRLNESANWTTQSGDINITTAGDYKVVLYWHNDRGVVNNPPAAVDNFSLMIPDCRKPQNLMASAITSEGATISWTGTALDWEVEYMLKGVALGSDESTVETLTENSIVLSGLLPNKVYEVYVKGYCGEGYSRYAKIEFRTLCGDMVLPMVESFENEVEDSIASCWTSKSGVANVDANYSINVVTPYGEKFIHLYGGCVLATPHIGVAGNTLAMDLYVSKDDDLTGMLAVGFVADLADVEYAEWVDTIDATEDLMSLYEVDFSSIGIAEGGYIIFKQFGQRYFGESSGFDIDNIYIRQMSDCQRPESLSVSKIGPRSAKLSWNGVGNAATYEVMYGTVNDPTSSMNTLMTGVLDDTLMLDQLEPETDYYVWVRSNCGEMSSEWRAGSKFTTELACAMVRNVRVSSLSYSGFALTWDYNDTLGEMATQTEVGWKRSNENVYHVQVVDQNYYIFQGLEAGSRYDVRLRTICGSDTSVSYMDMVSTSMYGHQVGTGETFIDYVPADCYYYNNYTQSVYLANELTGLSTISGIAYNVDCDQNGYNRTWDVYMGLINRSRLSTYNYVGLDSLTLVADSVTFAIKDGWSGITLDSPFIYDGTSNLVIAIKDHSDHREFSVYFDAHQGSSVISSNLYGPIDPANPSGFMAYDYVPDILFMEPMNTNGCDAPLAVVGSVGENSVDLVWNTNDNATGYQVEYRLLGATDWTVFASNVVDSNITVNGLSSGMYYNFRVGMTCEGEMLYSSELSALTLCGMADLPYVENFEGEELNNCWTFGNKTDSTRVPELQHHYLNMTYTEGGYAILPEMSEELTMVHVLFDLMARTPGARMVVAVGEDNTDINSFEVIDTFRVVSNQIFTPYECDFTEYYGMGRYIAFIALDKNVQLDNVLVELLPSCGYPTDVVISDTATTSATLAWNNEVNGTTRWMIVYGVEDRTERDTAYAMATENSYQMMNLLPNKSYEVMLYNICSEDTVGMLMPLTFRTECGALTLPYLETFNDLEIDGYHPCWFTTGFHQYGTWSNVIAPSVQNQGSAQGKVMMFGDNADIISPKIEEPINTIMLSLDAKIDNTMFGGDLAIGFTTVNNDIANAVYVDTIEFTNTDWNHYDISFANANSVSHGYIVFKNFDNTDYTDWADGSTIYYNGYIDNVMIMVDNGCEKVENVTVGNITQTTAEVTFDDASATGDYTVGYSTENDTANITMMQHGTSTTITLTNLDGGTQYYVWVRKNCGAGSSLWTEPVLFRTPCEAIAEMPYSEHFDSYTGDIPESLSRPTSYPNHPMPACWEFLNMSQNKNAYPQVYMCHPNSFIGYSDSATCLQFRSGANTSVFAVMPEFTTHVSAMELSFMYRNESISENNGTLTIGVITDITDTNTFVAIQTLPQKSEMTSVTHNFQLDQLDLNSDYRIAFRYTGGPRENYRMTLDRVELTASSACITPENLAVRTVTSSSIALTWAGVSSTYNVQYREVSETAWINAPTISGTYAVLNNLTPQVTYEARVQSDCGEEVSDWTEPVQATTGCAAAALPFVEDFNNYEAGTGTSTDVYPPFNFMNPTLPDCWSFLNMSIPTPLGFLTSASNYATSGMCFFMLSDSLSALYAILPEMGAPVSDLTIDFTYRNEGVDESNAPLEIGVMTNPMDQNTFRRLETFPLVDTKTNTSHVFSMDSNLNANTTYFIAFRYGGRGVNRNQRHLSIDDIVVDYSTSCHKPNQFRVTNVTADAASLQWFGDADNYEVNYRLTSEQQWTSMTTTEMHMDLLGLEGNSQYSVKVRALCDGNDNSEWTSEIVFTTECAVMDLPYSETFTGFSSIDFDKYCWNRYYGWMDQVLNNGADLLPAEDGWGFSDVHPMGDNGMNMWINIWGANIHDWSVSPQINLTSGTSMTFDMARYDNSGNDIWQADDKFAVLVSADDGNTWQLLNVWDGTEFENIPEHTSPAMNVTIDLSQFDNETVRLAFYAESTGEGSNHMILIDNIEVTGSSEPNPDCATPNGLLVSNITDVEATFAWQGSANGYELQYRRVDAWNWITVRVNGTNYTANDLQAGTTYEWRVRSVCGEGAYSWWSDNEQFVTTGEAPICERVSRVSVDDIDNTSAHVSWTNGGDEMKWELEYGEADFVLGEGVSVVVNEMEYYIDDLVEGTMYDVYVRAICGENFYSEWSNRVQFSTTGGDTPEGVDGVEGDYELTIYPNPTSGVTTIRLNGVEGMVKISVIDINGRTMRDETVECSGDCEKRMDVDGLSQGAYFIRVVGDNINSVRKLIVR